MLETTNKPKEFPPKLTIETLVEYIRKDVGDETVNEDSNILDVYKDDGDGIFFYLERMLKHFDAHLTSDFDFYRYFHDEGEINLVSAVKGCLAIFYNWKKWKRERKLREVEPCTPRILFSYMSQSKPKLDWE